MKIYILVTLLFFSFLIESKVSADDHSKVALGRVKNSLSLYNKDPKPKSGANNQFQQWFTGPLFTPAPITLDPKHPGIGIGAFEAFYFGEFDKKWRIKSGSDFKKYWSTNFLIYPQFGITKRIGMEGFTVLVNSYSDGNCSAQFQDTVYRIGCQLTTDQLNNTSWTPDSRLILEEMFPTGKYNKLDPNLNGIDLTGQGSYQTGLYLAWQKSFKQHTRHAFNLAGAFGYLILSSSKIKGLNFYGGSPKSEGRAYPGNVISIFSSGELELTEHINLSYDSNFRFNFGGKYKSKSGDDPSVKVPQFSIFYFTVEAEVTISERSGFLLGPYFTIAGQRAPAFVSFFLAYMYLF